MSKSEKANDTGRRDFLKLASVSAPAAVAAATLPANEAEAVEADEGNGVRDTAHTRAYFDSARF